MEKTIYVMKECGSVEKKSFTEKVIEVKYPYTNAVVGTVPAGTAEHAAKAF